MKHFAWALLLFLGVNSTYAQGFEVSQNSRYIIKDKQPFLWVGDTAWELFHALDRDSATYYLKRRAEQGFTVIQAVVLAELDGLHAPNAYGNTPLLNDDPTSPNEAYFEHVDFVIDKAEEFGLNIGLLPTWGDKIFKDKWGIGPEIFNPENARKYGFWIGNRYKNRKNIIWILGGDRNPRSGTQDKEIWNAMAAGLAEAYGGNDKVLIGYHPQPNKEGASEWFHNEPWFDFNMFQTGHCRDTEVYDLIGKSYKRQPTKPVIDGEPIYEDHPVCFNAKELGTTNAFDVRKALYLDVFAGAFGFTYGCHDIWQFHRFGATPVNGPHFYWKQAMELPAANQVKFLRKLLESQPLLERVPDQSLIFENNLSAHDRIQAVRGKDYLWVYSAVGKPFTVVLGKISGNNLKAKWLNPRNGEIKEAGDYKNQGKQKFTPPISGYGQDWVLILEKTGQK